METKTCNRCGEEKSVDCFSINKTKSLGRAGSCKDCHRKYCQEHYVKNKPKYRKKATKWRRINYDIVSAEIIRRKSVPCIDCCQTFPWYAMDFDHVTGVKEFGIGGTGRALPLRRVLQEMGKCEVVCAVCHRIRTYQRNAEASFNSRTSGSDPANVGANPAASTSESSSLSSPARWK